MIWNQLKTVILLATLSGLLLFMGRLIGGTHGLHMALMIALVMNIFAYFFSDKMVLSMYRAQPLDRARFGHIYAMVEELCQNAHLPMPKLWYIPTPMANAFATGRSPAHASVAVTQGILDILNERELRGVLAHEISHVKNRDILVATVAAVMATAISYLADMIRWSLIFGGLGGRDDRDRSGGAFGAILFAIVVPIAAMLIQLAVSRSREYLADESGADCCHDPLALASALEKLNASTKGYRQADVSAAQAATASMFIVYPFSGKSLFNLFSTHPPMEKRVARLRQMAERT